MKEITNKKLVIINLVFYVVVIFTNFLGAKGLINGSSQKAVSESFPTMITPAGFAFSIWGVIYGLMLASFIILFIKSDKEGYSEVIKQTSFLFWASSILNILWIVVFSYRIMWLAMMLIWGIFLSLLLIIKKLNNIDRRCKSLYDITFGIYSGWVFAASFVNTAAFLVSIGFGFFGNPIAFYSVLLLIVIVVGVLLNKLHNNPTFYLSIAWAFFAIMKARSFGDYLNPMFLTLMVGIVICLSIAMLDFKNTTYSLIN